ncbi:hypothetical protein [Mycolicibacterium peregrinum]|uniref:hypothetical protein n=1 Tax=Mycolicibacterium peregrinum TaxID=43304 RepID=UPI000A439EA2|nr:hypothetical protein [Mycolicibacterium peregrinum]
MGDDQSNSTPLNQLFLGGVGVLVIAGAIFGSVKGVPDAVAVAGVIAGFALIVCAAFASRIKKIVLAKDKVEFELDAAEKKLEQGEVVDAEQVPAAVEAVKEAVSQFGVPTVSQEPAPQEVTPPQPPSQQEPSSQQWRLGRNVQLVDDAVVTMATLSNAEVGLVRTEIARMSNPGFREEDDPRAIRPGDQGRSYRVRKVPGTDLRLWYRPLNEDHPETLVVMLIQRQGERV